MMTEFAIVGSHGLYANYGGWDELVKNLAERKSEGISYIIYNSADSPAQKEPPADVIVRRLLFRADGLQGIFYDFWSILLCYGKVDGILLLGVQGIPLIAFLRIFKKVRIVSNVGGIEWLRPKFGFFQKQYLKWCFNLSMRNSDIVILDNPYHATFLPPRIKADIRMVPYGGHIDNTLEITESLLTIYPFLKSKYFLSVSRALEDNQIDPLCQSFMGTGYTLVLISNLSKTQYGLQIKRKYRNEPNIVLIDGLYKKPELDLIRRKCTAYIHTHTQCGTAPSLVEMIIARRPIISFDNPQNRYTLNNQGFYYLAFDQVINMLSSNNSLDQFIANEEICQKYLWDAIIKEYESCF